MIKNGVILRSCSVERNRILFLASERLRNFSQIAYYRLAGFTSSEDRGVTTIYWLWPPENGWTGAVELALREAHAEVSGRFRPKLLTPEHKNLCE